MPTPGKVLSGDDLRRYRGLVRDVPAAEPVLRYAARLVRATHPDAPQAPERVKRFVRYGSSPRGAQAIILGAKVTALLAGRAHVDPEDVRAVAPGALRHRILLNFEGEAEELSADALVADILEAVSEVDPEVQKHLR